LASVDGSSRFFAVYGSAFLLPVSALEYDMMDLFEVKLRVRVYCDGGGCLLKWGVS
jgi:hypothetical protein